MPIKRSTHNKLIIAIQTRKSLYKEVPNIKMLMDAYNKQNSKSDQPEIYKE